MTSEKKISSTSDVVNIKGGKQLISSNNITS